MSDLFITKKADHQYPLRPPPSKNTKDAILRDRAENRYLMKEATRSERAHEVREKIALYWSV